MYPLHKLWQRFPSLSVVSLLSEVSIFIDSMKIWVGYTLFAVFLSILFKTHQTRMSSLCNVFTLWVINFYVFFRFSFSTIGAKFHVPLFRNASIDYVISILRWKKSLIRSSILFILNKKVLSLIFGRYVEVFWFLCLNHKSSLAWIYPYNLDLI